MRPFLCLYMRALYNIRSTPPHFYMMSKEPNLRTKQLVFSFLLTVRLAAYNH